MTPFDRMTHAVTFAPDGSVHVQNFVGTMAGQHHVHSAKGYKAWLDAAKPEADCLSEGKGTCGCGLTIGQVRSHSGHVSTNNRFEA